MESKTSLFSNKLEFLQKLRKKIIRTLFGPTIDITLPELKFLKLKDHENKNVTFNDPAVTDSDISLLPGEIQERAERGRIAKETGRD
jgi:hypothetical protein